MDPEKLLSLMNRIDAALLHCDGHKAELCRLTQRAVGIREPAALQRALNTYCESFPETRGWLCRQSDVVRFQNGALPLDAMIQYGELAGNKTHGLLIRPDGRGGWRLIYQEEHDGKDNLAVPHRHLGRRRGPSGEGAIGHLRYRVYWQPDTATPSCGYRQVGARFLGFDDQEVAS